MVNIVCFESFKWLKFWKFSSPFSISFYAYYVFAKIQGFPYIGSVQFFYMMGVKCLFIQAKSDRKILAEITARNQ